MSSAGRPTLYTDNLADRICDEIGDGLSLRHIATYDDMPARSTMLVWLAKHPDFRTKYACARELQADDLLDEMQNIADEGNPEDTQRARLRVATMQWRAAKLAPKKYGDKIDVTSGGDTLAQPRDPVADYAELAAIFAAAQARKAAATE